MKQLFSRFVPSTAYATGFALVTLLGLGCAGTGPNLRALRVYQRQAPTAQLLHEHIVQLRQTLELGPLLLEKTAYTPGAPWVAELPLDEARLREARKLVKDKNALFLEVYNAYARQIRKQATQAAKSARNQLGADAIPANTVYPSLRAALEQALQSQSRGARAQALLAQLPKPRPRAHDPRKHRRPPSTAATRPNNPTAIEAANAVLPDAVSRDARIVSDAYTVVSVALRMAMEAAALAGAIVLETAALVSESTGKNAHITKDHVALIRALPGEAQRIKAALEHNVAAYENFLDSLSALRGVEMQQAPGFALDKEGWLDELVGFGWDSIHVDIHGAGQALFYHSLTDPEFSGNSDATYDYFGKQTELHYNVEPIILASTHVSMKIDWPRWANAILADIGYATNRVYKSGGSIENSSLAKELGVSGSVSDALDAVLRIAGIRAEAKIAHFTNGAVQEIFLADGSVIAEAPLAFDMKRIDLGYDFATLRGPLFETLALGFRYFDYTLPRILYELQNSTPDESTANYVLTQESPPQAVRTRQYMLAANVKAQQDFTPRLTLYGAIDLGAGLGPTSYFFLKDPSRGDIKGNRDYKKSIGVGISAAATLGLRYRFVGEVTGPHGFFDGRYAAQLIDTQLGSKKGSDTIVKVGGLDIFHGPTIAFGAGF